MSAVGFFTAITTAANSVRPEISAPTTILNILSIVGPDPQFCTIPISRLHELQA